MGAAVVPIIGQIIVSTVVSKVAAKVASKIGLSDTMAGLVGIAAGVYAGAQIEGGIGTSGPKPAAPPAPSATPAVPPAPSAVGGEFAGTPSVGGNLATPGVTNVTGQGGMLTQGAGPTPAPKPSMTSVSGTQVGGSTAKNIIQSETVGRAGDYWSQLFSPQRTADMLMAGAGGMAEQSIAKEDREYDESVARANAQDWQKAQPGGLLSLNPNY